MPTDKSIADVEKYMLAEDMSSSITGDSQLIPYLDRVGFQIKYTGTPTGSFSVEISNDKTTWETLTLSTAIEAAGSADNHFIDCETSAKYIRLLYTSSSGAGSLNVHIFGKSISG